MSFLIKGEGDCDIDYIHEKYIIKFGEDSNIIDKTDMVLISKKKEINKLTKQIQ